MLHLVYCCIPQFYFVRFRLLICPEVEFADSYFIPPPEHIFHFRPFQVWAAILPVHWNSKFQVGFSLQFCQFPLQNLIYLFFLPIGR